MGRKFAVVLLFVFINSTLEIVATEQNINKFQNNICNNKLS